MFFGATRSIAARRSPVRPKRGYRELKDWAGARRRAQDGNDLGKGERRQEAPGTDDPRAAFEKSFRYGSSPHRQDAYSSRPKGRPSCRRGRKDSGRYASRSAHRRAGSFEHILDEKILPRGLSSSSPSSTKVGQVAGRIRNGRRRGEFSQPPPSPDFELREKLVCILKFHPHASRLQDSIWIERRLQPPRQTSECLRLRLEHRDFHAHFGGSGNQVAWPPPCCATAWRTSRRISSMSSSRALRASRSERALSFCPGSIIENPNGGGEMAADATFM